jgi:hypothetical protein
LEVSTGKGDEKPLVLLVGKKTAQLQGVFLGVDGQPSTSHTLVVFPADQNRWSPDSQAIRAVRPDQRGRFAVSGLVAGSYLLGAASDVRLGEWTNLDFLTSLKPNSIPLLLRSGETTTQNLRMTR